jgi:hypothetical protein
MFITSYSTFQLIKQASGIGNFTATTTSKKNVISIFSMREKAKAETS